MLHVRILECVSGNVWACDTFDPTQVAELNCIVGSIHVRHAGGSVSIAASAQNLGDRLAAYPWRRAPFRAMPPLAYTVSVADDGGGDLVCTPATPVTPDLADLDRYAQQCALRSYMQRSLSAACRFTFASGRRSRRIRHGLNRAWYDVGAAVRLVSIGRVASSDAGGGDAIRIEADMMPDPALSPTARWVSPDDAYVDEARAVRVTTVFAFVRRDHLTMLTLDAAASTLPTTTTITSSDAAVTFEPLVVQVVLEEFRRECWRWYARNRFASSAMSFVSIAPDTGAVAQVHAAPPPYVYSPLRFAPTVAADILGKAYMGDPQLAILHMATPWK